MKYLSNGLKQLPKNLRNLSVNLFCNYLGVRTENMWYLSDTFNFLPKTLKYLKLDLS